MPMVDNHVDCSDGVLMRRMRDALRSAPSVSRDLPFPRDWWQHLAAHKLVGLGFDPDRTGEQADWTAIAELSGLIARETACVGLALAWLMNEMLGRFVIAPHAHNEAQRALLGMMARGQKIGALAISEPHVGAHPKHLNCRAVRRGNHWQLDGEKAYVSNGPSADFYVILAVTDQVAGRKLFDSFIVEANSSGLARVPSGIPAVLAPLGHCGLVLEDCRVAPAGFLDTAGSAFERIGKPLRALEDVLLSGTMIGAMRRQLDELALWMRGTSPTPASLRSMGALQLELDALARLACLTVEQLALQGPDDRLANLNLGLRIAIERWQNGCDSFAAPLDDHSPDHLSLTRDIRAVLGIARGVSEKRFLSTGNALINSKEQHEVPA
ncbi:acyl-CoA dehydrogenase family protein [Piscinibacter sakaiensis]|uniref:acyl-CoA dehydrogenase family protein n=1 Tax=Piscinibacter sakaiensis TaxID=1547922 RepID=UPI003AAD96CD